MTRMMIIFGLLPVSGMVFAQTAAAPADAKVQEIRDHSQDISRYGKDAALKYLYESLDKLMEERRGLESELTSQDGDITRDVTQFNEAEHRNESKQTLEANAFDAEYHKKVDSNGRDLLTDIGESVLLREKTKHRLDSLNRDITEVKSLINEHAKAH